MKIQFTNGFADGWKMAVPEVFASSLKDKNIDPGEIFYDTQEAYRLPWNEALHHIKYFVQVDQVRTDEVSFTVRTPTASKTQVRVLCSKTLPVTEFISCLEHGFDAVI